MKRIVEFPVTFLNSVDFECILAVDTEILNPIVVDDELKLRILEPVQRELSHEKRRFVLYNLSDSIDENTIKAYIGSLQYKGVEKHIFEIKI